MPSTEEYCALHTSSPDEALTTVYRSIMLHTANPYMASSPYQGTLLQMLAEIVQPETAVEIGGHAGYGAMCIARGMSGCGTLHIVEANEEYQPLILQHARTASLEQNIRLHIGQAADIIPTLPDNIGLAYIDADKENYSLYYSLLLPKMKSGGILLFDNMLWYGRVIDFVDNPDPTCSQLRCNRETRAIHALNQRITTDTRVENILLPVRDGLMLCRVKD